MACLGKLTSPVTKGKLDPRTLVFATDISWEEEDRELVALSTLRDAKTCKPGECQFLQLQPLKNLVCPVEAIKRRLLAYQESNMQTLFSYPDGPGEETYLTKDSVKLRPQDPQQRLGLRRLQVYLRALVLSRGRLHPSRHGSLRRGDLPNWVMGFELLWALCMGVHKRRSKRECSPHGYA
jgi:hypothetical protein